MYVVAWSEAICIALKSASAFAADTSVNCTPVRRRHFRGCAPALVHQTATVVLVLVLVLVLVRLLRSIDTANLQVYGGFYNGGAALVLDAAAVGATVACIITATLRGIANGC